MKKNKGFTLIELLVVISIIGTLVGLIVNNMASARARARDSSKKSSLTQLKTALRLYYNDYQAYPTASGDDIMGCDNDGKGLCPTGGTFSAGAGPTIYMRKLPANIIYQSSDNDSFTVKVTIENTSDPDLLPSQTACPDAAPYTDTEFVVCAD